MVVVWTEYLKHRARVRGFDLAGIEEIVRFSDERYFDTASQRRVAIGKHGRRLVMIPYEQAGDTLTPITIHATTRQQTNLRVRVGRYQP
ncbi:MAG: hypothetical protein HY699_05235 [Deltaproteobacteria bacterium]|nr:hypothetical protein [Deltaproteobacteria bacterium]